MEQGLKERLVGAAVIVIVAVIFIPMLLDNSENKEVVITRTNIPPVPESIPEPPQENEFSSRIVPLKKEAPPTGMVKTEPEAEPAPTAESEPEKVTKEKDKTVSTVNTRGQTPTAAVIENEEPVTGVGLSAWVVQLGSFSSKENAENLNKQLRDAGFRAFVEPLKQKNTVSYRVRVGPELKRSDAEAINTKIKTEMKLDGIVVQYP